MSEYWDERTPDTYVTQESIMRRLVEMENQGEQIRARRVLRDMAETEEIIGNVRLVEWHSAAEGHQSEITTNPLFNPTVHNGVIGRRVSHEGLDWGIFSMKYDYVGRQEDYDDHDDVYWGIVRKNYRNALRQWGVEWDPTIVF